MKIAINNKSVHKAAIVLNLAESSYATFLYGFLGNLSWIRTIIMVFVIFIDVLVLFRQIKKYNVLFCILGIIGILYGSTCLLHPINSIVISSMIYNTINYSLTAFLIYAADENVLYSSFKTSGYWILFFCLFEPITKYTISQHDGYMVFGFRIMIGTVLLIYYYFAEHKLIHIIVAGIGMAYILLFGNRSALLIPILCFTYFYIKGAGKAILKKNIALLTILSFILVIIQLGIGDSVINAISGHTSNSRTLSILSGESSLKALSGNGREIIWANCISLIKNRPITGYGIGGDRLYYLLGLEYGMGVYAHNAILELLIDFGIPLGIITIVIIAFECRKAYKMENNELMKGLLVSFFISSGVKLMLSSSIWVEITAYICLGLILRSLRRNYLDNDI